MDRKTITYGKYRLREVEAGEWYFEWFCFPRAKYFKVNNFNADDFSAMMVLNTMRLNKEYDPF